ncbi:hypothetical protein SNC39_23045, partial [Escherichia coli]|nr:hypothetical protein [Escherichia coli]
DRNRSHWSTSKTPSYTKSVSWQHHRTVRTNKLFIFKISIQFNILNMNVSVFKILHLSGFFLIFNAAL